MGRGRRARLSLPDGQPVAEFKWPVRQAIAAESCDYPIDTGFIIARFFCTGGND
jgi:hypothetical protein